MKIYVAVVWHAELESMYVETFDDLEVARDWIVRDYIEYRKNVVKNPISCDEYEKFRKLLDDEGMVNVSCSIYYYVFSTELHTYEGMKKGEKKNE